MSNVSFENGLGRVVVVVEKNDNFQGPLSLSNKMAHYKCPNKLEDVSKKNVNNIAIKDSGCMVVDQFQSAE